MAEYGKMTHLYTEVDQTVDTVNGLVPTVEDIQQDILGLASDQGIDRNKITTLESAVAELIDSGAKNLLNWTAESTATITIVDNSDGTFTLSGTASATTSILLGDVYGHGGESLYLSGCPDGGDYAGGYSLIVTNPSGTTQGYDEGAGYEFTRPSDESFFRVYCRVRAGTYQNVLFKPMVCSKAAWAISQKFVPYCPTLAELYAMIQNA